MLVNKKNFKHHYKKCILCNEDAYCTLDVHRNLPGEFGGKYREGNVVCLCANCHRKVHDNLIKIIGWKNSTAGKLLHIIKENGKEDFIKPC